nr:MAG: hypothetical protein [Chiromantes dehaani nimavirus]
MFILVLLIITIGIITSVYIAGKIYSATNFKGVKESVNEKIAIFIEKAGFEEEEEKEEKVEEKEEEEEEEKEDEDDLHYTEITGIATPSQATYKTTTLCTLSVMPSENGNHSMLASYFQKVKVIDNVRLNNPVPDKMKFKLHTYDLKNYHNKGEYVIIEAVEKQQSKWGRSEMFVCNITADYDNHSEINLKCDRPENETWVKYKLAPETVFSDDRFFQIVRTKPKEKPNHLSFFHLNTETYLATSADVFDRVLTLISITGEMERRAIFEMNVLPEE